VHPQAAVGPALARVRAGAWGAAQCGLGAFLAWEVSTQLLHHPRPYFASVAAVVSLGLRSDARLRRTAELAAGVSAGILIGDLLVQLLGQGAWQIGVVVTVALLIAVAVGGTGLAISQAGLQAVFVVALPRTPHSALHRWEDALIGGAVALAVAALLPSDPWREAKRLRHAYVTELAAVLRDAAQAVRVGSAPQLAEALAHGRSLDAVLTRWQQALATGREAARLSPFRGERELFWEDTQRLTTGLSRASRNLRVLVRRSLSAIETHQPLPACAPDLLEQLADAIDPVNEGSDAVTPLLELAARLDPVALGATGLAGSVVVAQLRVAVIDLLTGLGIEHDRARNALPELIA
jgi:uncharacterized membrane protein YgaE (UPF0421/DUF939 family)